MPIETKTADVLADPSINPGADLWMRHPTSGEMERISDEHHTTPMRVEFQRQYLAAGWTDPVLRRETIQELRTEIRRLKVLLASNGVVA